MPPLKAKKYIAMNVCRNDNENTKFLCGNYPSRILSNLYAFRERSSFCDVEIVVDSRIFKVASEQLKNGWHVFFYFSRHTVSFSPLVARTSGQCLMEVYANNSKA